MTIPPFRNVAPDAIEFLAPGDGTLRANGKVFHVRGANWFGSEGRAGPPGGLQMHSVEYYLAFLRLHGFNAIRVLFNHRDVLESTVVTVDYFEAKHAQRFVGKTYLELFVALAEAAARYGLLVMMACHRLDAKAWPGDGLWYDGTTPESRVMESWDLVAASLCGAWNVFAVDLMNEPHAASWGKGDERTDWGRGAERLGNHVLSRCPRWLVMVEGVGYTPGASGLDDPSKGIWWGSSLAGV